MSVYRTLVLFYLFIFFWGGGGGEYTDFLIRGGVTFFWGGGGGLIFLGRVWGIPFYFLSGVVGSSLFSN